jgi:N-acyl-D-amino-acid deacylase
VAEALRIGAEADIPVQISHHKAAGVANWGKVAQSLALIEAAQAAGQRVHADQYPYTAGSTTLDSVVAGYSIAEDGSLPPSNLVVASCDGRPEWEGRSMAELAQEFGCSPLEAANRVLETTPTATAILHMMDEADVRTVMTHPSTVIGSDGLPTLEGKPHPRLYNTFARVLGHYSRDLGLLPTEEAVARMTGRSAAIFGLADRGYLRAGLAADVVVFDPQAVIDRGTFDDPNRYPDGIHHVFVNGEAVVRDGQPTGARPGQVLRRAD